MQLTYERQGEGETPASDRGIWRAGDSIALATRDEFLDNLGKAPVLVNIIDPTLSFLEAGFEY